MISNTKKNEKGFSLIELLIVSIILMIILGLMATIVTGVQSSYKTFRDRSTKHNDALAAMNLMTRLIRNAGYGTTQVPLVATGNTQLEVKSDWNVTDNALDDPFEDVQFYVSTNTLYLSGSGMSPSVIELANNVQSINFTYFDASGATTTSMTLVARVKITLTIIGESQPLVSSVDLRGKIQPR